MVVRCLQPCQINYRFLDRDQEAEFEDTDAIIDEAEAKEGVFIQYLERPHRSKKSVMVETKVEPKRTKARA